MGVTCQVPTPSYSRSFSLCNGVSSSRPSSATATTFTLTCYTAATASSPCDCRTRGRNIQLDKFSAELILQAFKALTITVPPETASDTHTHHFVRPRKQRSNMVHFAQHTNRSSLTWPNLTYAHSVRCITTSSVKSLPAHFTTKHESHQDPLLSLSACASGLVQAIGWGELCVRLRPVGSAPSSPSLRMVRLQVRH